MNRRVEDVLRAALAHEATAAVPDDEPAPVFTAGRRRQWPRWGAPLLAAAAVAGLAVGMSVIVATSHDSRPTAPVGTSSSSPSPAVTTPPATSPTSSAPPTHSSVPVSPSPSDGRTAGGALLHGNLPLWPFATYAAAEAWRTSGSGSQPWHASAYETARGFVAWIGTDTNGGFKAVGTVTSTRLEGIDAHIGVGYADPNGKLHTAAVLHLVRYGQHGDSPWEVVGSDDTTFSIDQPAYGATVTFPMTVGGHITGVDENINVFMRHLQTAAPFGTHYGLAAGGENSPWQVTVEGTASTGVTTIVAYTGGHLQAVERFAVQGVVLA